MTLPLQSIEQEAADCRKAFANSKIGDPVWLCHHSQLFEVLTEPAEERISYILSYKPETEQALRLREFRPMLHPERYTDYWDKLKPLHTDYDAKCNALHTDHWDKRDALYTDYRDKRDALYADYRTKRAPLDAKMTALHKQEYPDTTWNGTDLFAE